MKLNLLYILRLKDLVYVSKSDNHIKKPISLLLKKKRHLVKALGFSTERNQFHELAKGDD